MIGYTFHGMNMSQLALWFFIYSFCGWAMECVVIRIQLGRWENRGFAKLPFCVHLLALVCLLHIIYSSRLNTIMWHCISGAALPPRFLNI